MFTPVDGLAYASREQTTAPRILSARSAAGLGEENRIISEALQAHSEEEGNGNRPATNPLSCLLRTR